MALLHHFARGAAPVFLALLLIGCAGTDVNRSARWGLDPDGAFYVAWPVDPRYTEVFHERLGKNWRCGTRPVCWLSGRSRQARRWRVRDMPGQITCSTP